MTLRVLATFLIASSVLSASEGLKSSVIDLSSGRLYGHKFPENLADCVKFFGKPTLNAEVGEVMILGYGKRHLFLFNKGRFRELQIADSTHFSGINEWIGNAHPLDNVSYQIRPGLEYEMSPDDAAAQLKTVGIELNEKNEKTKWSSESWYRDGAFRVDLEFSLSPHASTALSEVNIRFLENGKDPDLPKQNTPRQRLPKSPDLSREINLSESTLYGLPIPQTPEALRKTFGEASYSASCGSHSIFGYGERHLFAYTNGQLAAIKIAAMHDFLNYGLTKLLDNVHDLDAHNLFIIEPGISEKMQYEAIREAFRKSGNVYRLSGENAQNPTELSYIVGGYHVGIDYANYTDKKIGISEIRIAPLLKEKWSEQELKGNENPEPESEDRSQ